eukprot:COSAG02_NODE_3649_length_6431_cov_488.315781_3_plen_133_part_00
MQSVRSSERGVFGDADNFEIEGDGPLGIVFRKSGNGIAIRSVMRDTVASESHGILDGMLLLAVEDRETAEMGFDATIEMMCAHALAPRPRPLPRPLHPCLVSADKNHFAIAVTEFGRNATASRFGCSRRTAP